MTVIFDLIKVRKKYFYFVHCLSKYFQDITEDFLSLNLKKNQISLSAERSKFEKSKVFDIKTLSSRP